MTAVPRVTGSKLLVKIGDGADPEVFTADCLINTSRGIQFQSDTNEFIMPDCDNPDDPAWKSVTKDGLSATISGAGMLYTASVSDWWNWYKGDIGKNIQFALNVPLDHRVGDVPTLLVAPRDAADLLNAAVRGDRATLWIEGVPVMSRSANLIARRPGNGRTIIVTTPLSGWTAGAGERGSGIAAFLRLAGLLASRHREADIMFVGLVGHERENAGGARFMATHAPAPDAVRLWVHIGANFAARDWHEVSDTLLAPLPAADAQRYILVNPDWLDTIRPALRGLPGMEMPYPAIAENATGEARQFLAQGYTRFITNFGAHRLHHAATDLPAAVDTASLEATWAGWSRAVLALLDGPAAR